MRWKFRIWGFGEAIALRGLYQAASVTGDSTYRDHVDALLEVYVNRGVGMSAEEHIAPGSELLLLYERTGDERYLGAAQKLAALHAVVFNRLFGRAHSSSRSTGVAASDLGGLHGRRAAISALCSPKSQVTANGLTRRHPRFLDMRVFCRMKRPGFSFTGSKRLAEGTGKSGLGGTDGLLWGL